MRKRDAERRKTLANHEPNSHEDVKSTMHDHKHFPTVEELDPFIRKEVSAAVATDLALIAHERHVIRVARHQALQETGIQPSPFPPDIRALRLRQSMSADDVRVTLVSLRNLRVDHRNLDGTERNRFNNALKLAHQAGTYQPLADIHSHMATFRMHSMTGAVGTQRFLPWHRLYVLQCENLLRTYEPAVRIPYWDYANDRARPDWVWQPPKVDRGTPGAKGGALPTQQTINGIDQNVSYTDFTFRLELDAHNEVHNWCNGTITAPPTAAYDPIFWLLHTNVDRLWNNWQMKHNGIPLLKALDWILDPFALPASDADSVLALGYWYG
jgi:hypothetical protein